MKISLNTLAPVFEALINGQMSREEASDWAIILEQEWDAKVHTASSSVDESVLYDSLDLLKAADFKNSPTEYFHVPEDFVEHYNKYIKR
ncbi:MAG: hypothetical protein R3C11_00835 [Planctomycetaceae bacterium]